MIVVDSRIVALWKLTPLFLVSEEESPKMVSLSLNGNDLYNREVRLFVIIIYITTILLFLLHSG